MLPDDVVTLIFSEWIEMKNLIALDCALCNESQRLQYLESISSSSFYLQLGLSVKLSVAFEWIVARKVRINCCSVSVNCLERIQNINTSRLNILEIEGCIIFQISDILKSVKELQLVWLNADVSCITSYMVKLNRNDCLENLDTLVLVSSLQSELKTALKILLPNFNVFRAVIYQDGEQQTQYLTMFTMKNSHVFSGNFLSHILQRYSPHLTQLHVDGFNTPFKLISILDILNQCKIKCLTFNDSDNNFLVNYCKFHDADCRFEINLKTHQILSTIHELKFVLDNLKDLKTLRVEGLSLSEQNNLKDHVQKNNLKCTSIILSS
jgi:hypothetical protein